MSTWGIYGTELNIFSALESWRRMPLIRQIGVNLIHFGIIVAMIDKPPKQS
jgi:hypothetical protein